MALGTRKDITLLGQDIQVMRRHLGPVHITIFGIGGAIGAGIFVLSGTVAANMAGPAVALSFALAALACLCAALCYAEFASLISVSGSAYTYAYATMGEFTAWLIGWTLILEYLFSASTIAVGWSGYMTAFLTELHIPFPALVASAPFKVMPGVGLVASGTLINAPAVALIAAMTGLLTIGIRESAFASVLLVSLKIGVILLVVGFGAAYVDTNNWRPFIPDNSGQWGHFGASGVLRGAAVVFFAYAGFDAVSTTSLEARNPKRDVPIGLIASLMITSLIYVAMCLVVTGLTSYTNLSVPQPIFVAIDAVGAKLAWLAPLVNIAAILGLASSTLVAFYGQTRVFYAMSADGLLPPFFSTLHARFRTPYRGTLLVGALIAMVAGVLPIETLGELAAAGTLLAFAIVCTGILVLRQRSPDLPRPFRTPFSPLVPLVGILSCVGLLFTLPLAAWIRLLVWMAIGLLVYWMYSRHHSVAGAALSRVT